MEMSHDSQRPVHLCPANIPIQMISSTSTSGKISPIRFRFETEEHNLETVDIEQIITRDEHNYVGIREKVFVCSAIIGRESHLFEIRYNLESQKWRIYQILS